MSDPVSAIGNPTPLAQASPAAAALPGGPQALAASVPAAQDPSPASQLELSPASGVTASSAPAPMTMEEAAQAYQSYLSNLPSNLQLQPNTEAGVVVIKVINPVTQKVIRQLPSDDMIQQAKFLRNAEKQNHSGILLDEKL